jgi:hypothetical protein
VRNDYSNTVSVLHNIISEPIPPVIASFTPASGLIGTSVTITGTNFIANPAENTVLFGTVTAMVTAATTTQLTVTVPAGATNQPIYVTVNGLTGNSSTSFTVTMPTTITSFNPTSGPVGTIVTINGTDFSTNISANIVKFGTVQAAVISATATQLAVIVPAGATSQPISVTVDELTAYTGTSFIVTIAPAITSFTPSSGPIGTSVTITGTNFSMTPTENFVLFGTVPATVTAATTTQLTVTVPAGATSQPISVTVNGLTATSGTSFTITIPPTILSFSPTAGPVGTTVTIYGSNFSVNISANIVKLGTVQAAVISATAAQLAVIVPAGAATQPISVTVDELTAYTGTSYIVTVAPAITSFTPVSGPVGTTVTIEGTNFGTIPADNTVLFGTAQASVISATATHLSVIIPAGATTQPITETVNGLTTFSATSFTVTAPPSDPPAITSFTPTSGPVGSTVTIYGSNFSTNISNNIVKFGTDQAAVISATATQLAVIVPAGATTQPIYVTVNSLTAYTGTSFNVTFPPVITSFTPASGPVGTTVTVEGTNFGTLPADNTVLFGTAQASIVSATATQLSVIVPTGATTQPITLTVNGLTTFSTTTFTVTAPPSDSPAIASFSPTLGPVGTTVTITGANFSTNISNNTVRFGTVQAAVISATATQLTVIVPAGATTQPIYVTVNGLTAYTSTSYIVTVAPAITSFTPASGPVGTTVTINGINFSAIPSENTVLFGTVPATVTTSAATQLTVTVPAGATSQQISVTVNELTATSGTSFTVTIPPTITSFSPASGPVGTTVTIYGSNFSTNISANIVKFGTVQAAVISATATQLAVIVPAGATSQPISVTVNELTAYTGMSYIVTVVPAITSFAPASGLVGTTVTINGTNFSAIPSENTVLFGAVPATVTTATATHLTVTVPVGATSQPISVTVNGLTASSGTSFTIITPPTISSFSPISGPVGTTVTIEGTNFSTTPSDNLVLFGTVQAAVSSATATQLTVIVPAGATTQPIYVTVNGLTTNSGTSFTVTAPPSNPPAITSFTPTSGPVGTTVTIYGSNFSANISDNTVRFGTVQAAVISATATQLAVIVPAGATNQPIYITVNSLTAYTSTSFNVTFPPLITSFTPASGPVGTTVTIEGTNFGTLPADNTVLFGTAQASVISATVTQMSVIVPTGAITQPITLTVNGLTTFSGTSFTVTAPPSNPPAITSFTPASGPIGTTVTINGSNFSMNISNNTVRFGTVQAGVISATTTQLTVIVPAGATTQPIYVTVNGLTAYTGTSFNVTIPPVITSFYPASGPVGDTVTIEGMNFSNIPADNIVMFGTVQATVTASTAIHLTVIVPGGAIIQPISVTVNGLSAISGTSFTVTTPPAIMFFNPTSGPVGTTVTITGSNFSTNISNNIVRFGTVQAAVISASAIQLSVIVPAGAASGPINLTADGLTTNSIMSFNVTSAPVIASFNPTSGQVGTTVTIEGANFGTTPADNIVFFGTVQTSVISATPTQLTVTVPSGATTQPITVTANGLTTISGTSFTVTLPPSQPPVISSFNPTSGPTGTTVIITGSNFSPNGGNNIVRFGNLQADLYAATSTQLTVTVPNGATKNPISVTVNGLTGQSGMPFNVTSQSPPPVINSFNPTSGPVGTTVTINGMNFSQNPENNIVMFGDAQATITGGNQNQITVLVPEGADRQTISVTVNGLTAYSSGTFTVTIPTDIELESSILTLNGDGINERLVFRNFSAYGKSSFYVYNSRGAVVFWNKEFTGEWDLTVNGRMLETGGYFYVIETGLGTFRGSFSILKR